MQSQCFLLVFYVYFLYKLNVVACESNVTSTTCPLQPKNAQCSLCISARNSSAVADTETSKLLDSYLKSQQILVYENGNEFVWYFNNNTMIESRHITITFYVWNEGATFGISIPGCCGLPLFESNCTLTRPISGNIYYSLTLFRSTVIKHHKNITNFLPSQLAPPPPPPSNFSSFPPSLPGNSQLAPSPPSYNNKTTTTPTKPNRRGNINEDNKTPGTSVQTPLIPVQTTQNASIYSPIQDEEITPSKNPSILVVPIRPAPPATWLNYTRYKVAETFSDVCLFTLDKDIVKRSATTPPKFNLESHLFKRGVFSLPGFSYMNDIITNAMNKDEVECTNTNFKGTSIFNFTSGDNNNDTFTCMVLWFTLNEFDELQVKCMPHNATYLQPTKSSGEGSYSNATSTYYPHLPSPPPPPAEEDIFLITIICSVAGGLFFFIILFIYCKRKRINKLFLSTKEVPESFKTVMNESPTKTFQFDEKIPEEKFTSFDELERQRIDGKSDLYKQQNITSDDSMLRLRQEVNCQQDCVKSRERTFNGYVEKDIYKDSEDQCAKIHVMKRYCGIDTAGPCRDLSEDSGISSGISSGFSPISESGSYPNRKNSCDQVFVEVHNEQSPNKSRDSGIATSPISSYSESGSHALSLTSQNSVEDEINDENKSISTNILAKTEAFEPADNFKRIAPEYCKKVVFNVPLADNRNKSISSFHNDDISSIKLPSKSLEPGVYSSVHDFLESPKAEVPREELEENNTLSIAHPLNQQTGLNLTPSAPCFIDEESSIHSDASRDSFSKHCKLDCNYNDLPTANATITSGYSSKDAFILPFEHVC